MNERESQHPVQPLVEDASGVLRFKANAIVRYLLDAGPFDLNQLALLPFSDEDRVQFAQLIGHSLSGLGDLSYVSDDIYERVEAIEVFVSPERGADLTLKRVVELFRAALVHEGFTGPNALVAGVVIGMARAIWIEHRHFPELPIAGIIQRHLTNKATETDFDFWSRYGLSAEDFKNYVPPKANQA